MKRAIISGATGAIGSALVKELISNEVEVLVLCRGNSLRNGNIPEHPLVTRKYCSLEELASAENDTGKEYDVFYHFAWEGTSGPGRNDMYLQNRNVRYALDAAFLASRFGCKLFIGAGSQAEYGRSDKKLTADTPCRPENGYGYAKLCAGYMTRDLCHQLGMKHIWVRVLSVYGPNDGNQSMVMTVINKLRRGEVPEVTKCEQIWDYLYSADAASAFRLLGEKGKDDKVYVLGSGEERRLSEYVNEIRDVVSPGSDIAFGAVPYGSRQVMHLVADICELQKDTGWSPRIDFKGGVRLILSQLA